MIFLLCCSTEKIVTELLQIVFSSIVSVYVEAYQSMHTTQLKINWFFVICPLSVYVSAQSFSSRAGELTQVETKRASESPTHAAPRICVIEINFRIFDSIS